MRSKKLEQAVQFAIDHETPWTREITDKWGIHQQDPPPWNKLLGPVHARGPVSGTVALNGKTLTSWGEPDRADLTFSIAKTYLALLAGVAHDRGLLLDVHEPVRVRVPGIGFEEGRNTRVTWAHLLQQTSEWEGAVFGVPDQADRYRIVQFQGTEAAGKKGDPRSLQTPGTYWEYNDVRINRMALSLLQVWQKPLPRVLKDEIMDRIGASDSWQYHGYFNSGTVIKGKRVESVSGGTRWGGGLWINTRDEARFGYLFLRRGQWKGKQIISANWIRMATTPAAIGPDYGYLWWLNTQRKQYPSAPASSFAALGYGSNTIWIDSAHDLIVVWRWHQDKSADEFFKRILAAVKAD